MIIGIDLSTLSSSYGGGVKTFSLGLLQGFIASSQSKDDIVLFVSHNNAGYYSSLFKDKHVKLEVLSYSKIYRFARIVSCLIAWLLRDPHILHYPDKYLQRANKNIIDSKVDALIVPTSVLNHGLLSVPTCLCIHDIQHEYYPNNFSFFQRFTRWSSYRYSALNASLIQVSSAFIRESLICKFPFLASSRVFIAPEGVDFSVYSKDAESKIPSLMKKHAFKNFLFYPAQLWPHKNHLLLVEALALYKSITGEEMPCILTGSDFGELKTILDSGKLHHLDHLLYLGFVPTSELRWLYQNCTAVLSCSAYESSSLPLREASVYGKPLICSDIPPYIEMSETFNLILYNCNEPSSLFSAIAGMMKNYFYHCSASSSNSIAVRQFDWSDISRIYRYNLSLT